MLTHQLRIIGGKWRQRKISIAPGVLGLRPTANRIRETLFNWVAPIIHQAYCADLFAGSGALGFEALSRGAAHVDFFDQDAKAISAIRKNAECLNALPWVTLRCVTIPPLQSLFYSAPLRPFDLVFVDPPYHQGLLLPALNWLLAENLVHPNSLIYVETEKVYLWELPLPFRWYRQQCTPASQYGLLCMT